MEELSLHILDLIENALAAGAKSIEICINEDTGQDELRLEVRDNGRGLTPEASAGVMSPFYTSRTTRRVGLGLPLLKATAEACEGGISLESEAGRGTTVAAWMRLSSVDRPPLGDIGASLAAALARQDPPKLVYRHYRDGRQFRFSSKELEEELGVIPLQEGLVLNWLRQYINEQVNGL
ncbi:MAG: hypothetical protein PWP65_985 [Clostridia bacterium]|nr:hypothetical protein [Clostridia bacterium]